MKASTKRLLNLAFIFATLAVVLYIGISGNELSEGLNALRSISPIWLLVCFLVWGCYMVLDTCSLYRFLRSQGYPLSFGYTMFVSIVGIYYSNITPGASGGQPMQVYYMKKRDVPIGIGTSAVTVKFFCFQLMLMLLGTAAWMFNQQYVYSQVSAGNMWILVIGYVFNSVSVLFVLMMAVSRRLVRLFIFIFVWFGKKLRIVKDPAASIAKWEGNLATFHQSIMMLRKNPGELFLQLLIAATQVITLMFITVAVYFAFSLTGTSIIQLITIGLMLYISASYTPLPGASGAQEGAFALYFAGIFPPATLFVALLIWRFFTFYLSLIGGSLLSVFQSLIKKKEQKGQSK